LNPTLTADETWLTARAATTVIAAAAGLPPDKVVRRLRRRFAAHGIGHNCDAAGVITLVLP
jgi:hypothetical protein